MSRTTPRRRSQRSLGASLTAILIALVIAAFTVMTQAGESGADPAASGDAAAAGDALTALKSIPVKGRAPATGYDRVGKFGESWVDVDGNGCDTRNDMLRRDLSDVVAEGCRILSGTLRDPVTDRTIRFVRGVDTSAAVQIDHVVALSNAWQTGAQQLTQEERVALANDPINLLAVDGPSNQQKSDGDAATWLPANKGFRCDYVARQVAVKARYDLWVTPPERDAMLRILDGCPGQPLPVG